MKSAHFYTETSLGMCRTFHLHGSKLRIEKKVGGRTFSEELDLALVKPRSSRVKIMNAAGLNRSITYLGVVLIAATVARMIFHVTPLWVAIGAVVLSLPALHVILNFIRPLDVEQFTDARGEILFDFIHSKKKSHQLEEFLFALRAALENNEPNQGV